MADPIIENAVRAQCIWKGPSGLPEDRFVTTWAFIRRTVSTADAAELQAEAAERLRGFWLDPTTTGGFAVASTLPRPITTLGLEVRTYSLEQAPPREPTVFNFTTTLGALTQELPRECAVTLSFYSERNLPRRRGRVYLGPLVIGAMTGTNDTSVRPAFRTTISEAAQRLANAEGVGDDPDWGVLSPTDGVIRPITNGWIDDAFDTQRSRGQEALTRTLWGPA